jgi:5-methyltetrahydropteroyltriglutamate--homocysteine methyltransferase
MVALRFLPGLEGVTPITTNTGIKFHGVETKHEAIRIDGKVKFKGHPHIEHFKFLKSKCRVTPKMTIPAPSTFHFRQGRAMVSKQAYPGMTSFSPTWPLSGVLRSRPFTMPVAAIFSSTIPPGR